MPKSVDTQSPYIKGVLFAHTFNSSLNQDRYLSLFKGLVRQLHLLIQLPASVYSGRQRDWYYFGPCLSCGPVLNSRLLA